MMRVSTSFLNIHANEPNADATAIGGLSKQKVTVGRKSGKIPPFGIQRLPWTANMHFISYCRNWWVACIVLATKRRGEDLAAAGTIEKK
eukprot:scaffold836_cov135-Skeletonema_marinoi.AAC.10